jgi:hypothetical protein
MVAGVKSQERRLPAPSSIFFVKTLDKSPDIGYSPRFISENPPRGVGTLRLSRWFTLVEMKAEKKLKKLFTFRRKVLYLYKSYNNTSEGEADVGRL